MSSEKDQKSPKPKRPLSAYNFFYKIERAKLMGIDPEDVLAEERSGVNTPKRKKARKHRKIPGMIGFTELAKKVSTKWRNMTDEERKPYNDMFEEDRQRYQREMMLYTYNQSCMAEKDTESSSVSERNDPLDKSGFDISSCALLTSEPQIVSTPFQAMPPPPPRQNMTPPQALMLPPKIYSAPEDTVELELPKTNVEKECPAGFQREHSACTALIHNKSDICPSEKHQRSISTDLSSPKRSKTDVGYVKVSPNVNSSTLPLGSQQNHNVLKDIHFDLNSAPQKMKAPSVHHSPRTLSRPRWPSLDGAKFDTTPSSIQSGWAEGQKQEGDMNGESKSDQPLDKTHLIRSGSSASSFDELWAELSSVLSLKDAVALGKANPDMLRQLSAQLEPIAPPRRTSEDFWLSNADLKGVAPSSQYCDIQNLEPVSESGMKAHTLKDLEGDLASLMDEKTLQRLEAT